MISLGHHCHDVGCLEDLIVGSGLARGEFYNLPARDVPQMRRLIDEHGLSWSIHAPLVQLDWYPRPPTWSFLCDSDGDNRELTMKMVRLTVDHAAEYGAEHVVVHFPAPAPDDPEEGDGKREAIAWRSCEALAELSLKKGVPIHIEGVGQSALINAGFLTGVLKEFTPLRYCFDTAHARLAALHNGFDEHDLLAALLPHIGSVHLWNLRDRDDYLMFHHIPVHPGQDPEAGWVDIARIVGAVDSAGNDVTMIFENEPSYPEALGGHDYREGVQWVKGLLGISS